MAEKILVVDDEPDIVESMKMLLEMEEFEVLTAPNGPEALKILETEDVDLVLLDFFMPEMTGRDVFEKIVENPKTKNVKVIFVTVAEFGKFGKKTLEDTGVKDFIQKPINVDDFLGRVKAVLGV